MIKDVSLFKFRSAMPAILGYQVISKFILALMLRLFRVLSGLLLFNVERAAFTSGDLPYLLRTWQGWVLVLIGFAVLVLYTVFDINANVLLSESVLRGEKIRPLRLIRDAFAALPRFLSGRGVVVVVYVALIAPLAGAAIGISLTANFTIPEFIMSVINDHIGLRIAYDLGMVALFVLGFIHLFTFHFIMLGGEKVGPAMKHARALMKEHWKDFLARYLLFLLKCLLVLVILVAVVYILPMFIVHAAPVADYPRRVCIVFCTYLLAFTQLLFAVLFLCFNICKLTMIYESYVLDPRPEYTTTKRKIFLPVCIGVALIVAFLFLGSTSLARDFDKNFPAVNDVGVIAHRGGGTLGNENTVLSLNLAIQAGADATEIDVQRTADNHYIINHDSDFFRCCGVSRKPGEMTLAEIKELQVVNAQNPLAPTTEVATLEEILDAAKGELTVYIELKGESADRQMADDVYAMVVERDMLDECVFISLDYEVIDYIETTYPDAVTGYLCYFAFGEIGDMNCDIILLESESATESNIDKIHAAGKKVSVWTVNTYAGMTHYLSGEVDGIITDEVALATITANILSSRNDMIRVAEAVFW